MAPKPRHERTGTQVGGPAFRFTTHDLRLCPVRNSKPATAPTYSPYTGPQPANSPVAHRRTRAASVPSVTGTSSASGRADVGIIGGSGFYSLLDDAQTVP